MKADDQQEPGDASRVTPGHVGRRRGPAHRIWDGFMADPSSVQRALLVIMSAILLTVVGSAVLMWLLDRAHYPDMGVALWWAIQTVTTVGYGDVAPADPVGRVVAGLVMLEAVAFVAIVTASITSIFMEARQRQRGAASDVAEVAYRERVLAQLAAIEARLALIEGEHRGE
jgi:voltage-gated potassium channel